MYEKHNLPSLSLGSANFNNHYGTFKKTFISSEEQNELLEVAWQSGFRHIDTAISYKGVHKEIGQLDSFEAHDWKLTTKIPSLKSNISKLEAIVEVESLVNKSLELLKIERLDSVLIHDHTIQSRPKDLEHVIQALELLRDKGLIKSLGISLYEPIKNASLIDYIKQNNFFVIQGPLNIFDRRLESYCVDNNNISFEARSIFLQGMLLDKERYLKYFKERNEINKFNDWLDSLNVSAYEACVSFIKYSGANKVIVGIGNLHELMEFKEIFCKVNALNPPIFCTNDMITNPLNWVK